MSTTSAETERYHLEAGRLCLDFANTVEWHASDHPEEELHDYEDLVAWAEQIRVLAHDEARQLMHLAALHLAESAAVYEQAIALREAIYRIFSATAHGDAAAEGDLALFNAALVRALAHLRIVLAAEGFAWDWDVRDGAPDRMLWPVVWSAANLLTDEDLVRVGVCADEHGCGWLFFDTSRNRSRRWCGMDGCGNRAKARRHYERKRSARQSRP
jgi:predicted RNA-binding Zn ribbon-like protein